MSIAVNDFNRYEQAILQLGQVPKELRLALAETCRELRATHLSSDITTKIIWETGINIAGPAFVFFTWWVLKEASRQNIRRLYFLARDGWIFMKIAELLSKNLSTLIDYRYLYGSRHLWLISSLEKIDAYALHWILSDWWYQLTIYTACERLGVRPHDIKDLLRRHGWDEPVWGKPLTETGKNHFKEFLQNAEVQQRIVDLLKSTFENTLGYLKHAGLAEEDRLFLVDIGWRGKPQVALNKILTRGGIRPQLGIKGFYFGLTEGQEITEGDEMSGFLFDLSQSLHRCQIRNNHIYEAFAATAESKVASFTKDGAPLFRPTPGVAVPWNIPLQQDSMLAFAKAFIDRYDFKNFDLEAGYQILGKTLFMFLNHPTKEEAEIYGQFPMDGEMTESHAQEIAPVVTRERFWYLCTHLKQFNLFWVQASLVRSNLTLEKKLWDMILPILEHGLYTGSILKTKLLTVRL